MSESFISDASVPLGWSYKGEGGKAFIKSPTGETYRSRRQAFEEMVGAGTKFSVQEILDMRTCLRFEGWDENDQIPQGWMIKRKADGKGRGKAIFLMEQGGKSFRSVPDAMKFVKLYQKYYSPENIHMLQKLSSAKYQKLIGNIIRNSI